MTKDILTASLPIRMVDLDGIDKNYIHPLWVKALDNPKKLQVHAWEEETWTKIEVAYYNPDTNFITTSIGAKDADE